MSATAAWPSDAFDPSHDLTDRVEPERDPTVADLAVWFARDVGFERLVAAARELGPDPRFASADDAALTHQARVQAGELAASTCRWLESIAELVVRGIWADQHATSPAEWLSWAVGLSPTTAREHVRVGLRLRELPAIRERFASGTISYSKVRAITRVATPEIEPMLLEWADSAPAAHIDRIVADFRATQRTAHGLDPELDGPDLTYRHDRHGRLVITLRLPEDQGLQVLAAARRVAQLEAAAERGQDPDADDHEDDHDPSDEHDHQPGHEHDHEGATDGAGPRDLVDGGSLTERAPEPARMAETRVHAIEPPAEAGPPDTTGADRHTLVVHVGADALDARHADADRHVAVDEPTGPTRTMSARTLRQLACDAGLVMITVDGNGTPMDVGRRHRRLSAALRRALYARDRSCRFPGCGRTRHLHAHHVEHWVDEGPTDLANLVTLCAHHHRYIHANDWVITAVGKGRFRFAPPDGGARPEALEMLSREHDPDDGALPRECDADGPTLPRERHLASVTRDPAALEPTNWERRDHLDTDLIVSILQAELQRTLPREPAAA